MKHGSGTAGDGDRVVIVAQMGAMIDDSPAYGTMRATIEVGKQLIRSGHRVTLLARADRASGTIEGVPFSGFPEERSVGRLLASCGAIDTLIGVSRADVFRKAYSRRRLVYHHGPHPIQEDRPGEYADYAALNRIGIHVVCPSRYSRDQQIGLGLDGRLAHVVYNGFSRDVFRPADDVPRMPHSLLFVGHVAHHKGVDIILRAFQLLSRRYPDATCTIAGRQCPWAECGEHLMAPSWLDASGMLRWPGVERDLPGVHFEGELTPYRLADLYRTHSMLAVASRIPETFGLVSLEAQGCGCLPILLRTGGFPETIREGETGYLYDELSPRHIAERIAALWDQGLPNESQRRLAQLWVAATFGWDKTGAEFQGIMTRIPSCRRRWRRALDRTICWRRLRGSLSSGASEAWWRLMRRTKRVRHALRLRS